MNTTIVHSRTKPSIETIYQIELGADLRIESGSGGFVLILYNVSLFPIANQSSIEFQINIITLNLLIWFWLSSFSLFFFFFFIFLFILLFSNGPKQLITCYRFQYGNFFEFILIFIYCFHLKFYTHTLTTHTKLSSTTR